MVGQETEKPEWIAPPRLGRHFKSEVTSGFREEVRPALPRPAERLGDKGLEEAPEETCGGCREDQGGGSNCQPRGLVPRQRVFAEPGAVHAGAIHGDEHAPGTKAKSSDGSAAFDLFAVLASVTFAVNVEMEERQPVTPSVLSGRVCFADVGDAEILRERDAVAGGRHGRSPESQPYGYPFLSSYPLSV